MSQNQLSYDQGQVPPVVAIVGPTASGKTDLAIELALRVGGEVVNADSMQFYRGMDIGTAKVTQDETRGVVHHLIDVLDIEEDTSAASFQASARGLFHQIRRRGKVPILVGGSGLYVRAALDIIDFPPTDPQVRQRLTREAQAQGLETMIERLAAVDPESAARVSDQRRAVRALEVYEISGRRFSSFMPQRQYHSEVAPALQLGLSIPRQTLHQRVAQRVDTMVDAGFVQEVEQLIPRGLEDSPTASRAIGYQQMLQVINGQIELAEAVQSTVIATRRFARRQETWFKADPRVQWLDWDAKDLVDQAVATFQETQTAQNIEGPQDV